MPQRPFPAWSDLVSAEPALAAAARRLLEDAPGTPGVAFLGTVGRDGMPRIHPFIPAIVDGGLWAFVIHSPKQRDLDRSGTYAVHSRLGPDDESFFCNGSAHRVEASDRRAAVAASMPYTDIDERHVLYELRLDRALWTTWTTPTTPVHRRWSRGSG